jgi:hypothetical protein
MTQKPILYKCIDEVGINCHIRFAASAGIFEVLVSAATAILRDKVLSSLKNSILYFKSLLRSIHVIKEKIHHLFLA